MILGMEEKFKGKYRIGSTRFKGWDYSSDGYYFVTICTRGREEFFGKIENEKMILNEMGKMTHRFWLEIPKHFKNVTLDEFIVMPNHVHGIVVIENDKNVPCRNAINRVSTTMGNKKRIGGTTGKHNPMLSENSLGKIIRWYKGRCTFEIKKQNNFPGFAWQSRFYDHIIRNEKSFNRIREYIIYNPLKWDEDRNNLENLYM